MRKMIVYHEFYGCETGCCGHYVAFADDEDTARWEFTHPYGDDARAFAEDLVRREFGPEHVADLDWDNCVVIDE